MNEQIIDALNYRYATKWFDTAMPVKQEDLNTILESLRLAPSSFGLEGRGFVVVEDKAKREELLAHTRWQRQVVDASHLLVLCRSTKDINVIIEEAISSTASTRFIPAEMLNPYKDMITWALASRSAEEIKSHLKNQVYIAAGFAMMTCAMLWIDSCPMEWFDSAKYDEVLWLADKWLASCLLLPIWYRAIDDKYATMTKVRKSSEEVIVRI